MSTAAARIAHPGASLERLRRADPGHYALKSAARAGIVMPAVFAFADKVIKDPQTATFAAFGSFAVLVLADFSGPRRDRFVAYLALAAAGAVLITLGTLCSRNPWLAAGAMAVVAFVILFSAVISGYFVAGATAAMLTFVLPVNLPASSSLITARLEGWGLAASVGICAVMLLWPEQPRDRLRQGIARACAALAELVEAELAADASLVGERAAAAREAIAAVRQRFLATPYRPTGPTGSAAAVAFLVDELEWFESLLDMPGEDELRLDVCRAENREALTAAASALSESAAVLDGRDGEPDLGRLDRARDAVAGALTRRIAELPDVGGEQELAASLEPSFRMRAVSGSARQIATNALRAVGRAAMPDSEEEQEARWYRPAALHAAAAQASDVLHATERVAVEQANPRSIVFRNSIRGAVALSISVFIAQEAGVQHAFWVVLGTLSVLRSNALATGATVLSALAGTAVGIVVGAGLILAIGTDESLTWAILPVAVTLAAFAPRVVSFSAGQAGFTIVVLMLFNLIQPSGWRVGIVRVEDVAIGFGVSIAVGLLFWPRGAISLMRDSLAAAYARGADYVLAAFNPLVDGGDRAVGDQAAQAASAATHRLEDAFRQYLGERSAKRANMEEVAILVAGARRLQRTARSLMMLTRSTKGSALGEGCAQSLDRDLEGLHLWYTALGTSLAEATEPPPQHEPDSSRQRRVLECARAAVSAEDGERIGAALGLLWASQHLDNLWRLEAHLGRPAAEASRRE
jgi:uncharacterized membrane protein YccC